MITLQNDIRALQHFKYLVKTALSIKNEYLKIIVYEVLQDSDFQTMVGSAEKHHAYAGGLLVHTAEVTSIAMNMAKQFKSVDYDVLATAAILHDFMKIKDYTVSETGEIQKTEYRKLVRHLSGSHAYFVSRVAHVPVEELSEDLRMKIEHAILAHHGRLEWQTAVEPITIEAHILHYADMLSYKFGQKDLNSESEISLF